MPIIDDNHLSLVEAFNAFLVWINQKGAAEHLIQYRAGNVQAPGDDTTNRMHKNDGMNWKDQCLLTLVYMYSGM